MYVIAQQLSSVQKPLPFHSTDKNWYSKKDSPKKDYDSLQYFE